MFPRTDGNAVSALTLGSQGCWSTAWPKASPFKSGCACSHLSASTTCSGNVDAARICATSESGYSAIGATNCCNCSGVCCAYRRRLRGLRRGLRVLTGRQLLRPSREHQSQRQQGNENLLAQSRLREPSRTSENVHVRCLHRNKGNRIAIPSSCLARASMRKQ